MLLLSKLICEYNFMNVNYFKSHLFFCFKIISYNFSKMSTSFAIINITVSQWASDPVSQWQQAQQDNQV